MKIKGLNSDVYLEPIQHRYFHKTTGAEYVSVSKFLSLFKKPFDKSSAYRCAGKGEYIDMTAEEVLKYWEVYGKERADEGTRIHNSLERFSNTTEILESDMDLKPAILNIASKYKDYYRQYNEVVLHDDDAKTAGTSDKVFLVNSDKDSPIDVGDFKSNLKGVHQVDVDKNGKPLHKYMLHCLSHLIDSKYSLYCLQLSDYAYKIEKQTGRKIRKLFIHYINPDNPLINYQIPVPYMRYEIIAMNEWYKNDYKATPEIISEAPVKKSVLSSFGNSNFLNEKKVVDDEFDLI